MAVFNLVGDRFGQRSIGDKFRVIGQQSRPIADSFATGQRLVGGCSIIIFQNKNVLKKKNHFCAGCHHDNTTDTVVPTKSDSDVIFCLQLIS